MVFENFLSPLTAERHPSWTLLVGFIYSSIGIFLGNWIFETQASLVIVFLTTMAVIPLIYNIIKVEEKKDLMNLSEKNLLYEHSRALFVFMFYFIGATLGFALWYTVLPTSTTGNIFSEQINTILMIRSNVTAQALGSFSDFSAILANNLKVLIFCIIFSFLYGLGAIFILTWNASVIGVAIGDTIKAGISQISTQFGVGHAPAIVGATIYGLFRYSIHGIPEILAYFIAGLAGGIISKAAIRHDFGTKKFANIVLDSAILLLASIIIIVIAAYLEVYVTPAFFLL